MVINVLHGAIADMKEIHLYIKSRSSKSMADKVILEMKTLILNIKTFPDRGNYVKELETIGDRYYRELHYKNYRTIYSINDDMTDEI